jgi:hypothetical protein
MTMREPMPTIGRIARSTVWLRAPAIPRMMPTATVTAVDRETPSQRRVQPSSAVCGGPTMTALLAPALRVNLP